MSKGLTEKQQSTRYWLTPKGEAAAQAAQEAIDRGELEPNQPIEE